MSLENKINEHYTHGTLLESIKEGIIKLGKTIDSVTIDDLSSVDEFHIGGRIATKKFFDQLNFSENDNIIDIGCGLGGTARYVAQTFKVKVTGIDLTQEYITTGNVMSTWVNLDKQVTLNLGNALSLPFKDGSFNGGYMMHVAMNIKDKEKLFSEIYRVLAPGSSFGVYDIMRNKPGELTYPHTWASSEETSNLATPEHYKKVIEESGFTITNEKNLRDFSLEFFKQIKEKTIANGGPPPLGLHTLMQKSTPEKLKNMVDAIVSDKIVPFEILMKKG